MRPTTRSAITTGSAATSITDSFNTDTVTVTATALAQNTALTLAGSAAEVVTGLVGDIAAGSLTGTLNVTTGNATDNGISITTGSAATSISASGGSDIVTVNAALLAQNTSLTLTGSAAEVVTGLVGDIAAGSLTGALTVTTGDAVDNGISITTGSAATSITAQRSYRYGDGDRHCARAEYSADPGGICSRGRDRTGWRYRRRVTHRHTERNHR